MHLNKAVNTWTSIAAYLNHPRQEDENAKKNSYTDAGSFFNTLSGASEDEEWTYAAEEAQL